MPIVPKVLVPVTFYSYRLSVFKVHPKTTQEKIMTQFGITLLCANTCQAKGRVERANQTLQDRLVKELRLHGISTIPEANAYLSEFIEDYNRRFGKPPLSSTNARVLYLLEDTLANRALRRKKIMLHEYPDQFNGMAALARSWYDLRLS